MKSVLFVDDEPHVLQALQRSLHEKCHLDTAVSGAEGLRVIQARGPFAVVVSDMRMPHMDGAEFLGRVKEMAPDTVRVMLTGNSDLGTAIRAVNQGAIFRFLTKPSTTEDLLATIQAATRQHDLITAERKLLEDTLGGCIRMLTEVMSLADTHQATQTAAVHELLVRLAKALAMEDLWQLGAAALLARIGTVAVPPIVLVRERQGGAMTGAEKDMLVRIPDLGFQLLRRIPRLEGVADIVRYQAKNYDGSGFPADEVAGTAIPLGARLLRIVVDLVTATTDGVPLARAAASLRGQPERHDPALLDRVAAHLEAMEGQPGPAPGGLQLRATELRLGDVLAASVCTGDGTVLVVQGTKMGPALRERLLNFAATVGVREPIFVHRATVARDRGGE